MDSLDEYLVQSTGHIGIGTLLLLADVQFKNPLREEVCQQALESGLCQILQHAGNFPNGYVNSAVGYALVQGALMATSHLASKVLPEENLISRVCNYLADHDFVAATIGTAIGLVSVYYAETIKIFGTPDSLDRPAGYIGALTFALLYIPLKQKIYATANRVFSTLN